MDTKQYTELMEYQIANGLWKYMSPCLLVVGLVGNILVLVVLSKTAMRQTTTSLYLRFLAVFDILVLYTGLTRHWVVKIADYDIRTFSPAVCKIHVWATYTTTYTSAWLLVSVTLERCGAVWFPHRVRSVYTKRLTVIIIFSIIIFMAMLNAHAFYGLGDYTYTDGNETVVMPCEGIYDDYHEFERTVWPWVDFCIYSVIPSSIMIVCNISIVYKVMSSNRTDAPHNQTFSGNVTQNRSASTRRSQASSLTAMLLVTSTTYVISTTPFCIYTIYSNVFHYWDTEDINGPATDELLWSVVNMLQYINNCINFILYCVSGQRFRDGLRAMVCGEKRRISEMFSVRLGNTNNNSTSRISASETTDWNVSESVN